MPLAHTCCFSDTRRFAPAAKRVHSRSAIPPKAGTNIARNKFLAISARRAPRVPRNNMRGLEGNLALLNTLKAKTIR